MQNFNIRTGYGYDVHKLVPGRKLILGGVEIPSQKGLEGHSDADILLHSLCDALLGAAGFEDIGHQFPNTDERYRGISSILLLEKVMELIGANGWQVINTDSMIILEEPKINTFIPMMKDNISKILKTKNISVKATTSEGLGFIGMGEGAVSHTTVLIYR